MSSYPPPDPRNQQRFQRDQMRAYARMQKDAYRIQRQQLRRQMRANRRSSIVGPILLIAIGVVFLYLQTGWLSRQLLWEWYTQWWPAILIGIGTIVLIEWLFDQRNQIPGQLAYRRTYGSLFFLIVPFLIGAGLLLSAARGHEDFFAHGFGIDADNFEELLGDKHESDQTLDLAFPTGGSVTVVNSHGDVTLGGTSDDGRIHLTIHKQVYSRSDTEAEAKARNFRPNVATAGQAITIAMPAVDGARADLVLTVPADAATTVTANHGDIHVASIKSTVGVTANHGDVELSAITGAATAHINSGGSSIAAHSLGSSLAIEGHAEDVTLSDIAGPVSIHGEFFGSTHLERIAGAVHFHTSRTDLQLARLDGEVEISPDSDLSVQQAMGPFILTTHDRNITLDRVAGDISISNRNGTVDLTVAPNPSGTALGNITLEDRNGTVTATLPERANFTVQADTTNGDIENDLGLNTQGSEHRKSLSGTIGGIGVGVPLLHITTTNADIALHKGAIEPLPPPPPAAAKVTLNPPPVVPRSPRPAAPVAPAP